ncbi:extensin-like [Gastrolobium bilobum]|uniref:extensin-like n=1 Tax=Gastrolobium bilobum TaxID=150636 RepID=UPI002AAF9B21|nr:extensin-like [Gastrolobium bilobum]
MTQSDRMETVLHMASDEAQGAFTYRQIYDETLQMMPAFDEFGRLTEPGEAAPPPAVVQTVEPPRHPRVSQRARHEGLPLHHQAPAMADRPVLVQSLPPRPAGQFYAPAYPPGGLSQPYWWPPPGGPSRPSGSSTHFEYPWFSAPTQSYPGYQPHFTQPFPGQQFPGQTSGPSYSHAEPSAHEHSQFPGQSSSQPQPGLEEFTEDYIPTFDSPAVMATPEAFSADFFQSPSSGPTGLLAQEDIAGTLEDIDADAGAEAAVAPGGDGEDVVRRNPDRQARERCFLSPYENNQARCSKYHGRPRQ